MHAPDGLPGIDNAASQVSGESQTADRSSSTMENEDKTGTADGQNDEGHASYFGSRFLGYLSSDTIPIAVGSGENKTMLFTHQALLLKSPYFATALAAADSETKLKSPEFPDERLDSMAAFLEYLYTGEYYPRKLSNGLERFAPSGVADETQLLQHASIYLLAVKFEIPQLKQLVLSKIACVDGTIQAEIALARFVYANTPRSDIAIRQPIATFWGQRSHIIRHEVEEEFQALCTDFPEFAFDVLTHVLNSRERKSEEKKRDRESSVMTRGETPGPSRKKSRRA